MKWYTYDTEVFAHDFIVVFKDKETGEHTVFHNDNIGVRDFINDDSIYCGFNSKGYDQYIIKAIVQGYSPEEVKQVNDWIIGGGQGWQCPLLEGIYYRFNNVDIMDDMQMGLSLKAIEGHLGLSIEETEVDFNLDRPLTDEEIALTIKYCKHDVDATEHLTDLRKDYLNNKIYLGGLKGIDNVKALSMTNAKLTALYVDAKREYEYDDEREYKYPTNLLRGYVPQEVFAFFDRLHDTSISDDDLFKSKLDITSGECPVTIGFGGIHGAIPFYQETETETRIIRNYDVGSYYPHLMTICGYTSRNIPDPKIYADMLETRMAAKKSGDMATANALKLVANTTYGAMLNKYNDLFDPLMGRSVCITGQLFLLELANHLRLDCKSLRIVQLNTDGIMVSFDKSEYDKVLSITSEWQERTGFELEEDKIKSIIQKDVNNYIEIPTGELYDKKGKPRWKIKGGYLVRGIAPAGAFNVNNNATIVAKAIIEYFVKNIPAEQTINECNDISQFQIIAKAGAKYKEAYHLVGEEKVSIQKVNRIYATADERYGKLYKVKAENESTAKIEMLPEHCIIDNDNHLTIDDVDKTFYIEMANKRINDFLGIKPEKKGRKKKMAKKVEIDPAEMNIYQKLFLVRDEFARAEIKRSGKNIQLSSLFYELADIIPNVRPILLKYRLLPLTSVASGKAVMTIVDIDTPEQTLVFELDVQTYEGNKAVTPPQAYGAVVTYYRRYLYMVALDIVEADYLENGMNPPEVSETKVEAPTPVPTPKVKTVTPTLTPKVETVELTPAPTTATEKPLTDGDGQASELQIKQLKETFKKLLEADPSKEEMVAKIAVSTQGFTNISKKDCENLIMAANKTLEKGDK
jgi:hypothetical protein